MPPSKWITHVKKYAKDNNISYKEALSKASPSYKKGSGETHTMPDGTVMKGKTHKGKGNVIASCVADNERTNQMMIEEANRVMEARRRREQEAQQRRQRQMSKTKSKSSSTRGRGCCMGKDTRVAPFIVELDGIPTDEGESPFSPRNRNRVYVRPLEQEPTPEEKPKKKKKKKKKKE